MRNTYLSIDPLLGVEEEQQVALAWWHAFVGQTGDLVPPRRLGNHALHGRSWVCDPNALSALRSEVI